MRGMTLDTACSWCASSQEDHNHLFLSCPQAVTVWSKLTIWTGISSKFLSSNSFYLGISPSSIKGKDSGKVG